MWVEQLEEHNCIKYQHYNFTFLELTGSNLFQNNCPCAQSDVHEGIILGWFEKGQVAKSWASSIMFGKKWDIQKSNKR